MPSGENCAAEDQRPERLPANLPMDGAICPRIRVFAFLSYKSPKCAKRANLQRYESWAKVRFDCRSNSKCLRSECNEQLSCGKEHFPRKCFCGVEGVEMGLKPCVSAIGRVLSHRNGI
jgi:hypothetical protein